MEINDIEKQKGIISKLLDSAIVEREKIRKISKELPMLRIENKAEIKRLKKLLLDCNCLIEMQKTKP